MEAVIGAVYVDGGWDASRDLVLQLFDQDIRDGVESPGIEDHKTRLQELVAKTHRMSPDYSVRYEGPDHARVFFATVRVDGQSMGQGTGTSKKAAEQHAAAAAWRQVQRTDNGEQAVPAGTTEQHNPNSQGSENQDG
jgi:ribonuclease-3